MAGGRACAFCGSTGPLTREHVFGNWLSKIGLDTEPAKTLAGPLNRIGKRFGVTPPFQTTVRNVCASCNNGWMERLEAAAQRVLTPMILGTPGRIDEADQGQIAAWVQKTALVAMLVSPEEDRNNGYGLPPSEYRELYERRDLTEPSPMSTFWVGRSTGDLRLGSAWVTPLIVNLGGLPQADRPHAYAMTIQLGELLLHGIRFTNSPFHVETSTARQLTRFWPAKGSIEWPGDVDVTDTDFLRFASGKEFLVREPELTISPWKPATELAESTAVGSMIELPTLCGKHLVYYPAMLVTEAIHGRFYWFMSACECGTAYLVHTEADGAHMKSADTPERIEAQYEDLPGLELLFRDSNGDLVCKREAEA
jgi:hypothetical protein